MLSKDFAYGYASSAYQIEGAHDEDGRGPSIWDTFSHTPGKIKNNDNGDVAIDSYHLFEEDIKLLKLYKANSYRFSLSWSRIIPFGGRNDPVNEKGIAWYSHFIDRLLKEGITPYVTLCHWDLPQGLEDRYGGWLDPLEVSQDFRRYARVCYAAFGDRVKHFITINEPWVIASLGYYRGDFAPGHNRDNGNDPSTEPWIVGHACLLSHAEAYHVYDTEFRSKQGGKVGWSLNGDWAEPYSSSKEDTEAAQRKLEFWIGWFADPIYFGDYPASMRKQLGNRLPQFTKDQQRKLFKSNDFWGQNHYTTNLIRHKPEYDPDDLDGNTIMTFIREDGTEIGEASSLSWHRTVPWGFRKLLKWIHDRYNPTSILVTENGTCCPNEAELSPSQAVHDDFRVRFYKGYLESMKESIELDHVPVHGYFAWSISDNYEWASGYTPRFGCSGVLREEGCKRYVKDSGIFLADWFEGELKTGRGASLDESKVNGLQKIETTPTMNGHINDNNRIQDGIEMKA